MKRNNFLKSKIYLATGKDVLRPHMHFVYFTNTHVYATNSYIAIRQCLEEFHNFSKEEREVLKGKRLHRDSFKLLKPKKGRWFEIAKEGVKITDGLTSSVVNWDITEDNDFPLKIEQVLPAVSKYGTNQDLGTFKFKLLKRLVKGANNVNCKDPVITIYCYASDKPMLVAITDKREGHDASDYDALITNTALVMPRKSNEKLKTNFKNKQ